MTAFHCPECGKTRSIVVETRPIDSFRAVGRERACLTCNHQWRTIERTGMYRYNSDRKTGYSVGKGTTR